MWPGQRGVFKIAARAALPQNTAPLTRRHLNRAARCAGHRQGSVRVVSVVIPGGGRDDDTTRGEPVAGTADTPLALQHELSVSES